MNRIITILTTFALLLAIALCIENCSQKEQPRSASSLVFSRPRGLCNFQKFLLERAASILQTGVKRRH
jgi:hypothetical protein